MSYVLFMVICVGYQCETYKTIGSYDTISDCLKAKEIASKRIAIESLKKKTFTWNLYCSEHNIK